ncbi:glycoside hydrolase family 43 protein [Asticcacaulis tiandongensis]|uniref:glycoside hydrolase family 43 protein n=1 Tax=Asticcacaulis tiandongensis TaxID=2565365 RepID=UPI00112DE467|nr:glycoside hydrolase 43 family protein [Asticcacaulis tiandongensis]
MRSRLLKSICVAALLGLAPLSALALEKPVTWTPDNGNGTFTNPIFYDEFSDPDLIRVGDYFYMTGTTMHTMPGLPILRSKDLVNWEFLTYALDRLDLGERFRLEGGKEIYGQGIWAPSLRYHNGTFYIFSNVNGEKTQVFSATDPAGPWTRKEMKRSMHDLSVLFDDDGKIYAIWGYQDISMVQLTDDLTDIVPGSERVIISRDAGMGEGVHFYKFDGKYYITSAWFAGRMRMPAARADHPEGPWEVNQSISIDEDFGLAEGYRLEDAWGTEDSAPFKVIPPNPAPNGRMSLHQGGIVDTPSGEWWGFSMMDYNSVGRLLGIAPITWKDGWPYFGLEGNLERNPRTWVKPKTADPQPITVPFERNDDFSGPKLKPLWQWNHVPVDDKWSLSERSGHLRLHALPAKSFWWAKNTLTQRSIGPISQPTVALDASGLKTGDVAGLGLLNRPYAWIGVEKAATGLNIVQYDQQTGKTERIKTDATRLWFRADCDFLTEKARFSYSIDGQNFTPIGDEFTMVFQLKTFQGVRYSLFNYNTTSVEGGYADFDEVTIHQPHPQGLMRPIPYGQSVTFTGFNQNTGLSVTDGKLSDGTPTAFEVIDLGLGRVALKSGDHYLSVNTDASVTLKTGEPSTSESFQWIETPYGELVLMSLVNHRFLRIDPTTKKITADSPGPQSDAQDGVRFIWK